MRAAFEGGERHRLHEHAQMCPLAVAHAPIDDEEHADRRAEKIEVLRQVHEARRSIFARDVQERVHVLADLETACSIGLPEVRGIDGTVVLGAGEIGSCKRRHRVALGARNGDHLPGLQISARRRIARNIYDLADQWFRDTVRFEGADRDARLQCFGDIHEFRSRQSADRQS
jgi:hypothetical protein